MSSEAAALALSDKPSIAVLPFENMNSDPEHQYFVDGMVEETTTQNIDPSVSAAFISPARCQVDSLMDFFGLAVNQFRGAALPQSPDRVVPGHAALDDVSDIICLRA
jgi:hypothetical protein